MLSEYRHAFMSEMAEEADRIGISFPLFWAKVQPRIDRQELKRGPGTPTDPRGWRPLAREVKTLMQAERTLQQNQAKPRTQIDTGRGTGKQALDWQEANNLAKAGKLSDEALEALVAADRRR